MTDDDVTRGGKVKDSEHKLGPVDAVRAMSELQLGEGAPCELVARLVFIFFVVVTVSVECLGRNKYS